MAALVLPAETSRSTCSSRRVSPCRAARLRVGVSASSRARSGAAPRSSKMARAAANSSSALSSSASARQARPIRTPDPRGLVGGLDDLPDLERAAQRGKRGRGVASAPERPRRGPARRSPPARPSHSRCDLLEFAAGPVCVLDVARGERDLDMRRQEPCAAERIGGCARSPGGSRRPRLPCGPAPAATSARPGCGSRRSCLARR